MSWIGIVGFLVRLIGLGHELLFKVLDLVRSILVLGYWMLHEVFITIG